MDNPATLATPVTVQYTFRPEALVFLADAAQYYPSEFAHAMQPLKALHQIGPLTITLIIEDVMGQASLESAASCVNCIMLCYLLTLQHADHSLPSFPATTRLQDARVVGQHATPLQNRSYTLVKTGDKQYNLGLNMTIRGLSM